MKSIISFLLLVAFIFLLGCKDNTVSNENVNKDLIPTKVGNKWNYETTSHEGTRTYHFNEITRDTTLANNEKWFVLSYDDIINSYFLNKEDGLWFLSEAGTPILYYKNPAQAGNTYQTIDSTFIRVVSVNQPVLVKAGTFNCIHYDTRNSKYLFDEYWAPGVGLVKLTTYPLNSNKQVILENTELISFSLK